jgi:predicted RNase H-like HicB family nuclease
MAQRRFRTNVVVSYEPDEDGWIRATLPGMTGVVTAGVSRDDAREMAVDALMQLLATDPQREAGADYERIRLDVTVVRSAPRDTARGRGRRGGTGSTSAGRPAPTEGPSS